MRQAMKSRRNPLYLKQAEYSSSSRFSAAILFIFSMSSLCQPSLAFCARCNRHLRYPQTVSLRRHAQSARIMSLKSTQKEEQESNSLYSSFYEKMKQPKTVAAPMVAQSDLAFRKLCRNHGTDLAYTQMIHSKNFVISETFQDYHLDAYPFKNANEAANSDPIKLLQSQIDVLRTERPNTSSLNPLEEHYHSAENYVENGPLIVQLAGHNPRTMVEAAQIILERTNNNIAGIDVNLGCPQTIARKGKYGAFLMHEDFDLVIEVLSSLRSSLPSEIGVTAKVRIPIPPAPNSNNNDEILTQEAMFQTQVQRLIEEAGIDMLTVHGRTLEENKTKVRGCNWDIIQKAAEITQRYQIPLIANGGIEHPSDVQKCLDHTMANAVMSSEGLLENPGLFSKNAKDETEMTAREIFDRQMQYSLEYLDLATLTPPLPGSLGTESGSFNVVRGHLFKFLYRYLEKNPDLRSRLGSKTGDMRYICHARDLVHILQERHDSFSDEQMEGWYTEGKGEHVPSSWYRRHRNAIQLAHTRNQDSKAHGFQHLSTEEKKKVMLERIRKLKAQKEERKFIVT